MAETIIRKDGATLTATPVDHLDMNTSLLLKQDVRENLDGIEELIMDFEPVEYISSAGLRVLLELFQDMTDKGGSMRVIHVNSNVMSIFELVNLTDFITVEE